MESDAANRGMILKIVWLLFSLFSGAQGYDLCDVESIWSKIVRTLLFVPLLLYALLSKLASALFGLFLLLLSLVPIPRLSQWCPPSVAIFDALLAIAAGVVIYVLILWAVAGEKYDHVDDEFVQRNEHRASEAETNQNMAAPTAETAKQPQWKSDDPLIHRASEIGGGVTSASGNGTADYGETESDDGKTGGISSKEEEIEAEAETRIGGSVEDEEATRGSGSRRTVQDQESLEAFFKNKDLIGLMYRA